jgi:amino acid transporter
MTATEQVQSFFEAYLAAPIVIIMFLAFKIIKKTKFRRLSDIDVDSGKRELDLPAILAEERAEPSQGRTNGEDFCRLILYRPDQCL